MSKTRTAALLSALLLAALIAPPRAGSTLQRRALLSERPRHTNDMPSRRGKKISVAWSGACSRSALARSSTCRSGPGGVIRRCRRIDVAVTWGTKASSGQASNAIGSHVALRIGRGGRGNIGGDRLESQGT